LVRQLHRCEFIDGTHNVVLIGGPGTGKTHIETALGVQAVEHHRKKVRFFSKIELFRASNGAARRNKEGGPALTLT
jgi:DNA replication protein DnaC